MLTINSKALKIGNKWLNPINGSGPTPPSTTYYVTTSGTHGSVTASPTEGTTGTEVTLSNTPDLHYHFDSYTLTGATLKNSNQFDIADSDVSVVGNFLEDTKYTVTVNQSTGGTISASPVQGYTGTEVTLSNTPATHYTFGSYNLTGATLKSANKFDIANSNVTVGATWVEDTKYTVTCTNDGHGTIAASPTSNYSGSTVTLSNTPNSGYDFDSYTLVSGTGASISGNTLTIGTSNVTVRGNFVQAAPSVNYDSYRLIISSIGNTYSVEQSGYDRYHKQVAYDNMTAVNINNLSRTATAGYRYEAGNSGALTSAELAALSTSAGFTPSSSGATGYVIMLEGGNLSSVSFGINITLSRPTYNNIGIQLVGISGTTTIPIAYKEVAQGVSNITLNTTDNPYIDYRYQYVGNGTNGGSSMMKLNQMSVTPTSAVAYAYGTTLYSTLSSSDIANLTGNNSNSPYVMPTATTASSEEITLTCILGSSPASVSITELGTEVSMYGYTHTYKAEIKCAYINANNYGYISNKYYTLKTGTGTVNSWPKTITTTV